MVRGSRPAGRLAAACRERASYDMHMPGAGEGEDAAHAAPFHAMPIYELPERQ